VYPLTYEADYVERRNRWRTGFRLLLAVPWLIIANVYLLGAMIVAFLAWFAIVFTGRYPRGLYDFMAGVMRFYARVNGWVLLQVDEYPTFGMDPETHYPIRLDVAPPLERYSRWKTGFRFIHGVPVLFMLYFVPTLAQIAATASWFTIVFTGRQPKGLHNVISLGNAYSVRGTAYFMLMTEAYPPISNQEVAETLPPGPAQPSLPGGSG
jgi:uncharacterized protein DUF4389